MPSSTSCGSSPNFSNAARAAAFLAAKSSRVQPVAVLLGQAEQAAQRVGTFVEPALQCRAIDQCGVMGEDKLAGDVVVVGQKIDGGKAELRVHEQGELHRLHVEVLAQAQRRRHAGQCLVHCSRSDCSVVLVWSSFSSMRNIHQSLYGSSCSEPRFILFITAM